MALDGTNRTSKGISLRDSQKGDDPAGLAARNRVEWPPLGGLGPAEATLSDGKATRFSGCWRDHDIELCVCLGVSPCRRGREQIRLRSCAWLQVRPWAMRPRHTAARRMQVRVGSQARRQGQRLLPSCRPWEREPKPEGGSRRPTGRAGPGLDWTDGL